MVDNKHIELPGVYQCPDIICFRLVEQPVSSEDSLSVTNQNTVWVEYSLKNNYITRVQFMHFSVGFNTSLCLDFMGLCHVYQKNIEIYPCSERQNSSVLVCAYEFSPRVHGVVYVCCYYVIFFSHAKITTLCYR